MASAWTIVHVEALTERRLRVMFADGANGEVDVSDHLHGPLGALVRDPDMFARVTLDEFGAPSWPCGFDLAPDALHERVLAGGARGPTSSDGGTA